MIFPIRIRINKSTLRLKLHYFLFMGGVASVQGFAPTIGKQLGYSPMVVGSVFTLLSVISLVLKPTIGIIVDKFRVKKILFLAFALICGFSAFALKFVHKIPTEAVANLSCDTTTALNVCSNNDDRLPECDDSLFKFITNSSVPIECQLRCEQNESFRDEITRSWNIINYDNTQNKTFKKDELEYLNVSLTINTTDQIAQNYFFQVESAHVKKTQVFKPTCQRPANTRCKMDCSNDVIMELASVKKFEGSVLGLRQFWEYFIVMSIFWFSQAVSWSLQDSVCFDILGTKVEDFGKQRCWGSVSCGIFAIFGGALVDYFSDSDIHKNYSPIYYLSIFIILCDFVIAYKIKVTETTGSKNTLTDICKLLTNANIVIYFIWIIVMGICTSMVWNYLFWYMEDLTQKYHSDEQAWTKTLQGLAIGIQCIGGEMPLLFFSGWIIKQIGHMYCMALGLFTFSFRFYMYSIITNPIWILPIEFSSGITFGLFFAVMMEYAKIVAPPSAVTTMIGISGALFEGAGISLGGLIGGFCYQTFGGVSTFKLFSSGSLLMGILHVLFIWFSKTNVTKTNGTSGIK